MKEIYKIQAEYIDKLKRFIFEGINNKSIEDIIYFIDDIELFWRKNIRIIKYFIEVNKENLIRIENCVDIEKNKVRVKVFNTGDNIPEEHMLKIWNRFYKIDESRNRKDGGTGIGLSLVRAIMNNYGNSYGVVNKENGVEFYFDLNLKI